MKILSWNVRGLNAPNKKRLIKRQILLVRADIILLQETKLEEKLVVAFGNGINSSFQSSLETTVASKGSSGGLMIIWKPSQIKAEGIASNKDWMLVKITQLQSNTSFFIIIVYGPVAPSKKRQTWSYWDGVLTTLSEEQVFIGGDFNAITNALD